MYTELQTQRFAAILDCVTKRGGTARAGEINAHIKSLGVPFPEKSLSRYTQQLAADGRLVHRGDGVYSDPAAMERAGEPLLGRLPYGLRCEGRILRHMVTHRYVRTAELIAHLRAVGHAMHRSPVGTALSRLLREGYVRRVAQGVYTLALKTLALLSLPDVCDRDAGFTGPHVRAVLPHIVDILGALGPSPMATILKHLTMRGFPLTRQQAYTPMRKLLRARTVVKLRRKTYALPPRKEETP